MTWDQAFVLFILPAVVAAIGWGAALIVGRQPKEAPATSKVTEAEVTISPKFRTFEGTHGVKRGNKPFVQVTTYHGKIKRPLRESAFTGKVRP